MMDELKRCDCTFDDGPTLIFLVTFDPPVQYGGIEIKNVHLCECENCGASWVADFDGVNVNNLVESIRRSTMMLVKLSTHRRDAA